MSETLTAYRKSIKLPVSNWEESLPVRENLDNQVHQAVASLSALEPDLQIARSADERGNCAVRVTSTGFELTISTRSGQDTVFQAGERRTFVSYTISAASSLSSLDRATAVSRELSFLLRGGGALLFAGLFFWGINALLSLAGMMIIRMPAVVILGLVSAGGWAGERLGSSLSARLEARAFSTAERSGSLPKLESLWTHLEQRLNDIVREFEKA